MRDISVQDLLKMPVDDALGYINGAIYEISPDEGAVPGLRPLRTSLEDFMDFTAGYMDRSSLPEPQILTGVTELRTYGERVSQAARACGITSFDERSGRAGVLAGFALAGIYALLDKSLGNAIQAPEFFGTPLRPMGEIRLSLPSRDC